MNGLTGRKARDRSAGFYLRSVGAWAIALVTLAARLAAGVVSAEAAPRAHTGPEPSLEVVVLGSGGPAALGRASSSYLVLVDGTPRILVDAGPGSFARVGETHLSLASVDTVLLTHLHVDHAAELPGFVKSRAVTSAQPIHFEIFGPTGQVARGANAAFPSTSRFIELLFGRHGAFAYLKDFSAPVSFQVHDLPGSISAMPQPRLLSQRSGLMIRAIGGHHGDAPAVIYRIDHAGRSVVFSGDIDPKGLPALQTLSRDANLLVFNSVVLDPPDSPQELYSLHSPPSAIGAVAAHANVGTLLLSHLSPAVEANHATVAASITNNYRGMVSFATDGMLMRP